MPTNDPRLEESPAPGWATPHKHALRDCAIYWLVQRAHERGMWSSQRSGEGPRAKIHHRIYFCHRVIVLLIVGACGRKNTVWIHSTHASLTLLADIISAYTPD